MPSLRHLSLVFSGLVAACASRTEPPSAATVDIAPMPPPTASPAAVTPVAPDSTPPTSIAGSTWHFCGDTNETVTFEAGGLVTFRKDGKTDAKGLSCGNAHWTEKGGHVTFDCRQFTEYAVVVSGGEMRGEWHRVNNPKQKAETCLKRDAS